MSARFGYRLAPTYPATLLVRGVLDAYTAPDLRRALLECLAEQPAVVLVDVTELSLADDLGLTVFAAVARECARWPGTRFAITGATAHLADAADRVGLTRHVAVHADRAGADQALSRWPAPPTARLHIPPDRYAPGRARDAVQVFCQTWAIRDSAAAVLVASELVTNAVVHAGTPIDLTLRLVPPHLHIAVRDGAGGTARIAGGLDENAESGRGLLLVDAMATDWGTFVPHTGKIVWARIRVRSAPLHQAELADRSDARPIRRA